MKALVVAAVLVVLCLCAIAPGSDVSAQAPSVPQASAPPADLDAFMAKVLEKRSETWRVLHDYILSERERFELIGPSDERLYGTKREFTWFVRDGYLIRSPVRIDGVEPDARTRQDYEERWLREEQSRENREAEKSRKKDGEKEPTDKKDPEKEVADKQDASASQAQAGKTGEPAAGDETAAIGRQGLEPRFISEAYFMNFKFDPGNYYLAGRETLDGRRVLRIEYYPTRLFTDNDDEKQDQKDQKKDERAAEKGSASKTDRKADPRTEHRADRHDGGRSDEDFDKQVERKMNKVALVTLWVDPVESQIVKYTFDNTDLNFLPGRWLLRVGDISASMTMGQFFEGVWLPRAIAVHASLTLANGTDDASYGREFFDYRQGEVKARIRSYTPREN